MAHAASLGGLHDKSVVVQYVWSYEAFRLQLLQICFLILATVNTLACEQKILFITATFSAFSLLIATLSPSHPLCSSVTLYRSEQA